VASVSPLVSTRLREGVGLAHLVAACRTTVMASRSSLRLVLAGSPGAHTDLLAYLASAVDPRVQSRRCLMALGLVSAPCGGGLKTSRGRFQTTSPSRRANCLRALLVAALIGLGNAAESRRSERWVEPDEEWPLLLDTTLCMAGCWRCVNWHVTWTITSGRQSVPYLLSGRCAREALRPIGHHLLSCTLDL